MDLNAKSESCAILGESLQDTEGNQCSPSHTFPEYKQHASRIFGAPAREFANGQPCFASSVYPQHLVSHGEEAIHYNPMNAALGLAESRAAAPVGLKTNGLKTLDTDGFSTRNVSCLSNLEAHQNFPSRNISQHSCSNLPGKQLDQVPQPLYNFDAVRRAKAYHHHPRNFTSVNYQKQELVPHVGAMGNRAAGRMLSSNYGFEFREKYNNRSEYDMSAQLSRGPRTHDRNTSYLSPIKELHPIHVKDKYNLPDFQTHYECAKFYVIKSYSEDDIHKCIKYHVWSSTPNGNKKLDAAFHDAEVKSTELGSMCPIFLFFSVNASGQFVGLAEMTGKVDFNKTMDFWQVDKWSGFFPVKWHIIKDIPNSHLRHIILENNDYKPVTYTRDTQEIELRPGLELLKIFKNYSARTSILEDFDFYEARAKANAKSKSAIHQKGTDHFEPRGGHGELTDALQHWHL